MSYGSSLIVLRFYNARESAAKASFSGGNMMNGRRSVLSLTVVGFAFLYSWPLVQGAPLSRLRPFPEIGRPAKAAQRSSTRKHRNEIPPGRAEDRLLSGDKRLKRIMTLPQRYR